jgi:hypothetical protein
VAKGDIHTVPQGDGWANKVEGGEFVGNTTSTDAEAGMRGAEMAREQKDTHLIYN